MTRRGRLRTTVGVLVAAAATIAGVVLPGGDRATATPQAAPAATEPAQKGVLSAAVCQEGTLTYRARPDGSPYPVVNQADGTFTQLPQVGEQIDCGDVLYRVDDSPVLLLCGTVSAYRALRTGDVGGDVRQLNQNLHTLGDDAGSPVSPGDSTFTASTRQALDKLQTVKGLPADGELAFGQAVFLPDAARVAKVTAQPGGPAQRGTRPCTPPQAPWRCR